MATATFDTLKYANTLKGAGVPSAQAEAQAFIMAEALSVNFKELATKDDLKLLAGEIRGEIRELEQRTNAKFDLMIARSDQKFEQIMSKMDQESTRLREEMKREFVGLRGEFKHEVDTIRGDIVLLRWMSGTAITLCITILFRIFWMK